MKKIVSILLCAIITLSCFAVYGSAASVMYGDIDGDKKVSAADARLVLRYSVKLENSFTQAQKTAADVNLDNKIDASDARSILRGSVNLDWAGDFGKTGSDILNGGSYYMEVTVTGSDTPFKVVNTENVSYMEIKVDFAAAFDKPDAKPVDMGILSLNDTSYMVSPADNCYLIMDENLTGGSGSLDMSELLSMFDQMGGGAAVDAKPIDVKPVTIDGTTYTARTFENKDDNGTTVHYLSGTKLCFIRSFDEDGTMTMEMIISEITTRIPENVSSIPANATIYTGETGMMAFMLKLVALAGLKISDLT